MKYLCQYIFLKKFSSFLACASHPSTAAGFRPSNASPEAGLVSQLHNGRRKRSAFAVVPYAQWVGLTRRAKADMTDEEWFDAARAEGSGERLLHDVVKCLVDGEPPLKVFREHRAMTQETLAEAAKVSTGYVSQIERGACQPSKKALIAFAVALNLDIEDLS